MRPHLEIVADGFRAAGFVLGIPSLLTLVALTGLTIFLAATIGCCWYLSELTESAGFGALASLAAALFAALLYFTGRGIGRHLAWARVVALLVSFVACFASLMLLLAILPNVTALLACVPMGLSVYAYWVLSVRFA